METLTLCDTVNFSFKGHGQVKWDYKFGLFKSIVKNMWLSFRKIKVSLRMHATH